MEANGRGPRRRGADEQAVQHRGGRPPCRGLTAMVGPDALRSRQDPTAAEDGLMNTACGSLSGRRSTAAPARSSATSSPSDGAGSPGHERDAPADARGSICSTVSGTPTTRTRCGRGCGGRHPVYYDEAADVWGIIAGLRRHPRHREGSDHLLEPAGATTARHAAPDDDLHGQPRAPAETVARQPWVQPAADRRAGGHRRRAVPAHRRPDLRVGRVRFRLGCGRPAPADGDRRPSRVRRGDARGPPPVVRRHPACHHARTTPEVAKAGMQP